MSTAPDRDDMLWKEEIANRPKHWVRAVTACNSKCLFCLDMDTPRNVYLDEEEVKADLRRGREELDAWKVILSGGEATLHPRFPELVRYAKEIGYGRVQVVTNGQRFGSDPGFFQECLQAGLGEITFSLHGHTPELHDRLTVSPGSFKKLMKGLIRALRDGRPIVNVDVVINKQNVGVLDKIVELCIRVGVTEFDLLHVIPQAEAFRRRDELFYNPRKYLPILHKVFRLNRHPRFVIWTNRFPIPFLEGMEDLIQDPHKMLDEVNGRRFHVRKYLDRGEPLECREPERCVHCFIEPFCTTMDRVVQRQNADGWEVWWGEPPAGGLPWGIDTVGMAVETMAELPDDVRFYARVEEPGPLERGSGVLIADDVPQLEAWTPVPEGVELEIWLNRRTAPWLLANAERLDLDRIRVHQPTHEHLKEAVAEDVRDPRAFFEALNLPVRVSNLPACLAPGAVLIESRAVLWADLFRSDTGRLSIRELARYHVREGYFGKSSRCEDCALDSRCDGLHVNMIRDQGLSLLEPLRGDTAAEPLAQLERRWPEPPRRIATGKAVEPTASSLPGYGEAPEPPEDPLAIKQQELIRKREARLQAARERWANKEA